MRILHVIKGLARGGAEQLLVSEAPHLDRSRFDYEVAYLLPRHNALVGALERVGLPVHCLQGERGSGWVVRLRNLVRDRGVQLVHIHSPYAAIGTRIGLLGRRPRVRVVYTEHSVWEFYHRATYWGNALTFPRNDHVFAASDHVRASIRYPGALRFLTMPPVETLYHGLDQSAVEQWAAADGVRDELGIPQQAPVVGMVGNFRPGKGHEVLLQSAIGVSRAVPGVRFVLVGHGPLEDHIRRRAKDLGLEDTVIFTGEREDAPRVAGTFDVFALPSASEGLAIALIEAMALGRASVVSRVGGLTEVVDDGKEGLVVSAGNVTALTDAIVTLLRDADLRRSLGAAARRKARSFDIRNVVRRYEEVYERLL